jgi:hypothetical protein
VYIDGYVIDMTSRQFEPYAPVPFVTLYETMRADWEYTAIGQAAPDDRIEWFDFDAKLKGIKRYV